MAILGVLMFVILETLAMAWVLLAKNIPSSVALGAIVLAEWIWETTHLSVTAPRISEIEPCVKPKNLMLIYAGCWIGQTGGALIFFVAMKVHTLPMAFELVAAHVAISTVFYLIRIAFQGLFVRTDVLTVAGHPWWEAGASCAGTSPTCGLLAILICKALRLF
jgi:hypothetical protein